MRKVAAIVFVSVLYCNGCYSIGCPQSAILSDICCKFTSDAEVNQIKTNAQRIVKGETQPLHTLQCTVPTN
ncbi:hypothetical protein PR003_g14810 [Phytophthora rubi]|uniref:Uncharacterized protein n=1 Tax=Phytophthora rubi TaxID=129364 RepID=A0A6A4F353_9STRA|nr:hypothetical protein PR002_g27248 [Phytophthora rubi]KAE8998686.1 hypothetical protein PR001_g19255 [Phytophthora rubi]KAE9331846.1 hypothetical protein PR003_g14810 [Phytophthora rubi]